MQRFLEFHNPMKIEWKHDKAGRGYFGLTCSQLRKVT